MNIQIVEDDRSLSDGIEISLSDGEATFSFRFIHKRGRN